MSDPAIELRAARELLSLAPPPGAQKRVLQAVLGGKPRRERRPYRALGLVLTLLITSTAAAVGGPALAKWAGWSGLELGRRAATSTPPAATTPKGRERLDTAPAPTSSPTPNTPTSSAPEPPADAPSLDPVKRTPPPRVATEPAPAEPPTASLLAQEVAAYREAAALVASSPGLALVRLRAHREHFPNSALAEEVSLRMVQAFTALGREAEARREAKSFVIRYPHSKRHAELQAVADGAPLQRPKE